MTELAASHGLDVTKIRERLRIAAAAYDTAETTRLDMANEPAVPRVLAAAKRLQERWVKLSRSVQIDLFEKRDFGPFVAGLDHLADVAGGLASRVEGAVPRPTEPRDALVHELAAIWRELKGTSARPQRPGGGLPAQHNPGSQFVAGAIELITGTTLTPDQVRNALGKQGKKRARKTG